MKNLRFTALALTFIFIFVAAPRRLYADDTVTRAEFSEMLLSLNSLPDPELSTRPEEAITRREAAEAIVSSMGYTGGQETEFPAGLSFKELALNLSYPELPFPDVTGNSALLAMAKDFGIIAGSEDGTFSPDSYATRVQIEAMLSRAQSILIQPSGTTNVFYAIRSAPQMAYITNFDSISFGWARLTLSDGKLSLNYSSSDGNEYYMPDGAEIPFNLAAGKDRLLMAAVENSLAAEIINTPALREQAVQLLARPESSFNSENPLPFDGIVVDFEGLNGEDTKNNFNAFLASLKNELAAEGKKMFVAVHPKRRGGHIYYDAYDYRTIGELADKVILMAHDYNAKKLTEEEMAQGVIMTPPAPIEEVYYALAAICDPTSGVTDKSKIMLQINFSTVQWKLRDGAVLNASPYTPGYDLLEQRFALGVDEMYSSEHESPYVRFYNSFDDTENIIWYEDRRSVDAKRKLASMFGVNSISFWRLGNIPGDILTP